MGTTLGLARRAFLVAFWFLMASLAASADGGKDVTITGSVFGPDAKPVEGVSVEANVDGPAEGPAVGSAVTDARGAFRITLSGVERCRLSFRHPDDAFPLLSRTEADGLPLYVQAGGTLDLGKLNLSWIGGEFRLRATFEGQPVAGVRFQEGPRVNRGGFSTTDEDGVARWPHQEKVGERVVLLADDGNGLTGFFVGEVKKAGEAVEADVELVRGKGSVACSLVDASGKAIARSGRVYLAPVCAEDDDTKVFAKETFVYDLSWRSEEVAADGTCEVADLPPGKWYVAAVADGVVLHPSGKAGTPIEVTPGGRAAVALMLPARTGIVQGEVNFSIAGRTVSQLGADKKERGKAPMNIGIFLVPRRADGRFFLAPFVPNASVDLRDGTKFEARGIPEGEYLAFAGGVRHWPNPEELPDVWMLHRGTSPTFAIGRVTVRAGGTTRINFTGALTAAEMSRRYREPLPAVERFFGYIQKKWK